MITSPRDLLFGYGWLDTLAHEYIHYVLIQRSHNTIPIWLHEGLAKFFDNRWREDADARLEPVSQDLLARSLDRGHLITFEQMHPSMAKLPSQEDTALAFAEVFLAVKYIKDQAGMEGIRRAIDRMRSGESTPDAIEAVLRVPFAKFQKDWEATLPKLDLLRLPGTYTQKLYFKNKDKSEDELDEIGNETSEKHVYLGDRLRAKKRSVAAAKQYLRAVDVVGDMNPVIQSRLGATWLELGEPGKALGAVVPPLKYYPDHVLLHLYAGQAHLARGETVEAAAYFERAIELNPFDPDVHSGLATAYEALGKTDLAARERRALEILQRESR
jgi:tetratricopeptide (TPR) repeat protein